MTNNSQQLQQVSAPQAPAAPKFKVTVNCLLGGFPIEIQGETTNAENLVAMIDRLKAIGATPPSAPKSQPVTSEDAPVCEFHGPLRRGNHGWFCPKKMGDGSYCKSKA